MIDYRNSMETKATTSLSFGLLVVSSIMSMASGAGTMNTVQRTLPAYALALNAERALNSSACGQELAIFREGVDVQKWWALKMLDASGQPKPGFTYGNNAWLGGRSQCLDLENRDPFPMNREFLRNVSILRKGEDAYPPYKTNYFMAYFRHNSTTQHYLRVPDMDLISLGICFPASCTTDQISLVLEMMFRERTLMFGELYKADFRLEYVKDLHDHGAWFMNPRMIIVVLVIVVTILLMIAGTAYDVLVYQKSIAATAGSDLKYNNQRNTPNAVPGAKTEEPHVLWLVLKCFSVHANTKYIFTTAVGPDNIGSLDGIRFLSMTWIIVGHMVFYTHDYMDNRVQLWRTARDLSGHIVSNTAYEVDTFFLISGFLFAYFSFKYYSKCNADNKPVSYMKKVGEFFDPLWRRLLRIVPAYMMMIGIAEMVYAWNGNTSVSYMTWERPQDVCPKYWWRNLLFISTLFPRKELCLSWSWYLSADMQFFVLGLFLIILSSVYFYTAATILGVVFVSSTIITGFAAYGIRYEPTLDDQILTLDTMYLPPWTRIGPYLVGIVTAYILVRLDNKLKLRRIYIAALWLFGCACIALVLLIVWHTQLPAVVLAIYAALAHTVWGVGIASVLVACITGNGGVANTILSFKGWIPLSKMTYSAYLLNPLIISAVHQSSEFSAHIEVVPNVVTFVGVLCITYVLSYVYAVMFESPYVRLTKLISTSRAKNR